VSSLEDVVRNRHGSSEEQMSISRSFINFLSTKANYFLYCETYVHDTSACSRYQIHVYYFVSLSIQATVLIIVKLVLVHDEVLKRKERYENSN
jgi:hypothetical protein